MKRGRRAAAVLGGFLLQGTVSGAAIGTAYMIVLVLVGSFGENDPGLGFFVDALIFAVPFGAAFGVAIGLLTGIAAGILFAALALAGALPHRGGRGSAVLTLAGGAITLVAARLLLGLFFDSEVVFVWGPAMVGAVAGAAVAHQALPLPRSSQGTAR